MRGGADAPERSRGASSRAEAPAARGGDPGVDGRIIPVLEGGRAEAWVRGRGDGAACAPPDVGPILDRVRRGGDAALLDLVEELDGVRPAALRVSAERCRRALEGLSPGRREALERAARNVERFHAAQRRREERLEVEPGVWAWREFRPIRRVGIYAPGGRASYPSSVLMAAIPARVAGCSEVALCSPPGAGGLPAGPVLAAAALAGASEVYAVGGAQGIAALAYGTETIRPVDKIYGPGNAWVTAAKLAVSSRVAIDLPAGPSEVVVWADRSTPPAWTAAELLAQAEHGPDSLCVGILPDRASAEAVRGELHERLGRLERPGLAASSLAGSALLITSDEARALAWIEEIAPEHLALPFEGADRVLPRIASVGSVFLGPASPVAAGDYAAGPNHVLPTGGRARAESGLCLDDFGRWIQVHELEPRGLERLEPTVRTLAEWEGLPAHAEAVLARRSAGEPAPRPAADPTAEDGAEPGSRAEPVAQAEEAGGTNAAGSGVARLLRPEVSRLDPYVTARSLHRGGILLDANESPYPTAPDPSGTLHRYPDPETPELRRRLATRLEVPAEGLWIGNGSDEAIDLLIRTSAAPGQACVIAVPTYGVYAARAAAAGVRVRRVPLDSAFDLDLSRARSAARGSRLVLLCSPNNPTGNSLSQARILELAAAAPCLVAVDEAYVEFSDRASLAARTRELENLVVIRTFSKAWGLAGARVGYMVGDPRLIGLLRRAGLPYPLSAPAARAACAALDREERVRRHRDRLVAERERLHDGLERLGLRVLPSEANFLLFFVADPAGVQRTLAERHGVVVRDRSRLRRLSGGLRVTVGRPEENDRFLDALEAVLGPAGERRAREGEEAPR